MRNLRIMSDRRKFFNSSLPVTASTWDPSFDCTLFTLGPTPSQQVIELRRVDASEPRSKDQSTVVASWDAPCPLPSLECDEVLSLHYFSHINTTCIILAGGDITHVRHDAPIGEEKVNIEGSVDEGLTAASWSPDEELLVLATRANTILFMTVDYENLASVTLSAEDANLSKQVSVGWGKVETQFKGKRARALRDPTVPEKVDEGILSEVDQKQTTISWRGDGAYVAVNSILEEGPRRMIRIYTREGVLDSVTEPVDGLEGALSWRPAGNLLAGLQRLDNDVKVIFFERNGLRHGQFSLRLSTLETTDWASSIKLFWNVDSSVLAVCFRDRIQVWTMGNYHYYLKQEFREQPNVVSQSEMMTIRWHPETPLRFSSFRKLQNHTPSADRHEPNGLLQNGYHEDTEPSSQPSSCSLRTVHMTLNISKGSVVPPNDVGMVAVIDGKRLKITPLRKSNIPPPMALYELQLSANVKDLTFNATNTRIAALHEATVSVISFDTQDSKPAISEIVPIHNLSNQVTQQICFGDNGNIFVLGTRLGSGSITLNTPCAKSSIDISDAATTCLLLPANGLDRPYILAATSGKSDITEVVMKDGKLAGLQPTETLLSNGIIHAEMTDFLGCVMSVCLKSNGILYANGRILINNCTSFLLTQSHIILTTTNHLLKFIHLQTHAVDLELPPDEPETDERCRSIERGARLVTVMPSTYSLVLHMPRGNLETIYPRALVLASIRDKIGARQYRKAFLTCRSQRVDMNIIHDYAPVQFLADVKLVIAQLKTVEYIDLFLAQLNDADAIKTLYRDTLSQPANGENVLLTTPKGPNSQSSGKVNRICDAFLAVLKDRYATNLQNVITANVCKVPPNIEAGLQVVASLREQNEAQAETALEHMCFLTDVNQVYERALGLYDLDLTLMVAQKSQKDPREYLPYLQTLQNTSVLRRQFTIDDDLKRHTKALTHLHTLSAFDEVKSYVQKHSLYTQALDLYRYSPTQWRSILRLRADFLTSRNCFAEAGIAYESLSDLPAALSAYTSAGLWRSALTTATLIPLPTSEVADLALSLRDTAIESKDHPAVATISADYLSDTPSAIRNLCSAHNPAEALRLAARSPDLLATVLDPALVDAAAALTELLADCRAQALAQSARLIEVRAIKSADPLRFLGDGETGAGGDVPDDISVAPTSTSVNPSLFTRYSRGGTATGTLASNVTRKTSKNARREERKRARGKKGSVYEEEYLVNSFERLVGKVNESVGDVREVVEVCCRRGGELWERSRALQRVLQDCLGVIKERMGIVFERPHEVIEAAGGKEEGKEVQVKRMGGDRVLWDAMEGSRKSKDAPVLKEFEGLELLS